MSNIFGRVRSVIRIGFGRLLRAVNVIIHLFWELASRPTTLQRIGGSIRKSGENLILAAFGVGLFLSDASWYMMIFIGIIGFALILYGSIMETINEKSGGDS